MQNLKSCCQKSANENRAIIAVSVVVQREGGGKYYCSCQHCVIAEMYCVGHKQGQVSMKLHAKKHLAETE